MFDNIGRTIKIMAKVFWWIGTITVVGIFLMWPFTFVLYGFGELIETQRQIAQNSKNSKNGRNAKYEDELPRI